MTRRRLLLAVAGVAAAVAAGSAGSHAQGTDPQTRRVYVTAIDDKGSPITDLTAADFVVKEGGKAREIVRAATATTPMQIAILVDDNGTGIFRYGVGKFIEALLGRAEFAISTVTGQTLKLVDYTTNAQALSEAIGKLTARDR